MLNKFLMFRSFSILALAGCLLPFNAWAQQCSAPFEMVTKLFHPNPGSYTVWNTVYGEESNRETFVHAINQPDNGVLAVGETHANDKTTPTLLLATFDRRGRKITEKQHIVKDLHNIIKIIRNKNGYVVLGNVKIKGKSLRPWLGFFDNALNFKSNKIISDKFFHLRATDIVQSLDKRNLTVAVTAIRKTGGDKGFEQKSASIYKLDQNGNELSSRAYILGLNSEIMSLSVSKFRDKKPGYIATGYFENGYKKKIGWVLRLNDDLSLVWQKEFSRGAKAIISKGIGYRDENITIFGEITPANSSPIGSWLMMLDGDSGKPTWQRYYYGETGHHDYMPAGLYANTDGLLTVMMMAKSHHIQAMEKDTKDKEKKPALSDIIIPEKMDYAHILTVTPRGVTLNGDSYYYGHGVQLHSLTEATNGNRIMVGHTMVAPEEMFREKQKPEAPKNPLREPGYINLPDAELSDKAKKGLAMLQKKLEKQHTKKPQKTAKKESAKNENASIQKAWVAIGEMPDTYNDPCL